MRALRICLSALFKSLSLDVTDEGESMIIWFISEDEGSTLLSSSSISSDGGDPKISDGMSFALGPMFDFLKFGGLLLIGVLVTIIVSSESSVSVGIVMGGVLNPVVSFPSDDVLDAVMGCASVPRKGTVTPEDVVSLFERLVDTRDLSVGKNFQFEDEFVSSFDPRTVSVFLSLTFDVC